MYQLDHVKRLQLFAAPNLSPEQQTGFRDALVAELPGYYVASTWLRQEPGLEPSEVFEALLPEVSGLWRRDTVFICFGYTSSMLDIYGADIAHSVLSMLIMALPTARWIFRDDPQSAYPKRPWQWRTQVIPSHAEIQELVELMSRPGTDLFDASGLRADLLARTAKQDGPLRSSDALAIAIDEEIELSFYHAYVAFKCGLRADTVTTAKAMGYHFANDTGPPMTTHLVIEDLYTNFPDAIGGEVLPRLKHRDYRYPGLLSVLERFVLTGGEGETEVQLYRENRSYLLGLRARGVRTAVLLKPTAGIHSLAEFFKGKSEIVRSTLQTHPAARQSHQPKGHGGDGRANPLVEHLTTRAEQLVRNHPSGIPLLEAAVCATIALRLGRRSPTLAFRALTALHESEVRFECGSFGVEYHFNVGDRLRELSSAAEVVGMAFAAKKRKDAVANAEVIAATTITQVFRASGQFDEELECLSFVRKKHRQLWFTRNHALVFLYPVAWYFEFLVRSIRTFGMAVSVVSVLVALAFFLGHRDHDFESALVLSTKSFLLGADLSDAERSLLRSEVAALPWVAKGLNIFHLGAFLSFLFSSFSRR